MPDLDDIRSTLARIPNPIAVLESLFALAPVGLQIYEASGRSLLVNQAFLEMFGTEPPPGYNVLQDEIAAQNGVLDFIQRAFKGETMYMPPVWYDPRELKQVRVERGNRVAMQANFFPLFDRGGRVSHVAVLFRDVTAETVHREELEQERELLAAIVDGVTEGIIMADEGGVMRLVNRAARDLGVRPGTPVERWSSEHGLLRSDGSPLPPEETPLYQALRGTPTAGLLHIRAPDGTVHALAANAVPLRRGDGKVRGAVTTTRDETERVRREEEVRQAAHFRERFIGILGHDLRTPLTAILASAGLVLRQRDLTDPVLAAAARITSSAERMGRMISDLLDFTEARLGGGLSLVRKTCDLGNVVKTAVDEVLASNPGRVIRVSVEGEASGAFDPDRVAQLLSNLLINALAYGPPDEPVAVTLRGLEGEVEITVQNAGAEIPPGEQEALFDAFRRGRTSGQTRGLGLGLFIVQQIAQSHGGSVGVQSQPNRTVFRVTLRRSSQR